MNNSIDKIYLEKIKQVKKINHPRILVNICSHGNEILGLKIEKLFKNIKIINGSITFNIGNQEAVDKKVRFIDSDLNRSFPGKKNGNKEEVIAYNIMKYIKHFDYLIDIHSTVSGLKNSIIVEDYSIKVKKIISVCKNADTVLVMSATSGSSIFRTCVADKIPGIAFEYGDNSIETARRTFEDLISILSYLKVVDPRINKKIRNTNLKKFNCYDVIKKKDGDIFKKGLNNFKLIKKGEIIKFDKNKNPVVADEDFYPILIGEKNYKDIFGFKGKLIK